MKIFYIGATCYTIYLLRFKKPYCATYDPKVDEFPHYKIIYPACLLLTLFLHTRWSPIEFLWSYSLWLEALAFVPQIIILYRIKTIENMTSHYVAALGAY